LVNPLSLRETTVFITHTGLIPLYHPDQRMLVPTPKPHPREIEELID